MKKNLTALFISACFVVAMSSCQKNQDATPAEESVVTNNSTLAINDSAVLTTGINAMIHGLASVQGINYNNFPAFQGTVWTYGGIPAPRRSLMKFDFAGLNAGCTPYTLVSAKLFLKQFDEQGSPGNYYSALTQVANDVEIRRIRMNWNPASVTWLTQPTTWPGLPTLAKNAVALSAITTPFSGFQDNQIVDVTDMVRYMLAGGAPYNSNFGFEIRFPNGRETQPYKARTFGSFASSDSNARPILKLYWQ